MYSPAQSFLKVCHGNFWQSLWTSRRLLVFLLLLWCCLLNSNQKSKSAPATNVKSANNWQSLGINVALSLQNCSGAVELVGGEGWKIVGLRVENLGGGVAVVVANKNAVCAGQLQNMLATNGKSLTGKRNSDRISMYTEYTRVYEGNLVGFSKRKPLKQLRPSKF